MKHKLLAISLALYSCLSFVNAQNRCGYDELVNSYNQKFLGYKHALDLDIQDMVKPNDERADDFTDKLYTIQVVFHVVYKTAAENVSDALLNKQIARLNKDYSATNPDHVNVRPEFAPYTSGDTRIRFALATVDPNGNPTTGIERRSTAVSSFYSITSGSGLADGVKKYATGGFDAWDPTRYLNIWICNMQSPTDPPFSGVVGYATPPPGLAPIWNDGDSDPSMQGVVLFYFIVGDNKGRTAVHEVGHYLGLRHVWGDAQPAAGEDFIWDTPAGASQLIEYGPGSTWNNPCSGRNYTRNKFRIVSTVNGAITTPNSYSYDTAQTYKTFYNTTTHLTDTLLQKAVRIDLFDSICSGTTIPDADSTSYFFAYPAAYNNFYYDTSGAIIDTIFVPAIATLVNQSCTKSLVPNTSDIPMIQPLDASFTNFINHGQFNDFFEDYMYYSSEDCQVAFTNQQRKLMQTVLVTRRPGIATVTINGIKEGEAVRKLTFSPNPANDFITVTNASSNANYQIYNVAGSLVSEGRIENKIIDISNLNNGIYTIKVLSKNETMVNKLIVSE